MEQRNFDRFCIAGFIMLLVAVCCLKSEHIRYIFPYFGFDEYCEEKYKEIIIIHNMDCPICKEVDFWFTEKENKYNIMIKKNACFCSECFSDKEVHVLKILHVYNLIRLKESLKYNGASNEYIKKKIKESYKSQRDLEYM